VIPQIGILTSLSNTSSYLLNFFVFSQRWMFEKYDGVRAFWNPSKQAFYSRHGNQFALPEDIVASMPTDLFLDGELW